MNKLLKTSIVTGAVILCMSSVSMAKFVDINEGNYYLTPITVLNEKGIINGYPDDTFKPANKVTRAEFAKMISTAEELKINKNNKMTFEDVSEHWGKEYIELAASNKLLKGYDDGTFKPEREITYGEVATILLRTLNIYEVSDSNTNWPEDCMNYASKIGLFDGVATNDLIGMNSARRDNVALMIWNKLNMEAKYDDLFSGDSIVSGDDISSGDTEIKDDDKENNKENTNQKDEVSSTVEIDTKKVYAGTVELITQRRGETFITIRDFDGTEREVKVKDTAKLPDVHTLLLYKITSKGDVRLKKQLSIADVDKNYYLVENADNELIKLKGEEDILDLELDTAKISGKTIKLERFTYYFLEIEKNNNDVKEFVSSKVFAKEELKLRKNDRIIFDEAAKMAFVIRGFEN